MPSGTILCANPLVAIYDDVFSAEEAQRFMDLGGPKQEPGVVLRALGERETDDKVRTNTQARVDQWADPVLSDVVSRIAALTRLPPENAEHANVMRYEGDQKFDAHVDGFNDFLPAQALELRNGGQRLFTTLLYLNDLPDETPPEAGATVFPRLRIAVRPKLGRVLLFANTAAGTTALHPHAVHAGRSTDGAVKWAVNISWRENVWHEVRDYPEEAGDILTY